MLQSSISLMLIGAFLIGTTVAPSRAIAARLESGKVKTIYIEVSTGNQVSAIEADKLTTNDKAVLGCKAVEKVCNEATGKCSIKNVK